MRRLLLLIGLAALVLALAACDGDDESSDNTSSSDQLGLFDWNRDPDAIVVRLDSLPNQESSAFFLNTIPPCTVWGDGRVVWVTRASSGAEEVLEARVDDVAVRGFLEDIISRGFYNWEDEWIPPSTSDPTVETITISLYDEVHTVRRFSIWPQNGYIKILENCQLLSDTPVRVLPDAGWVSAYSVPRDIDAPSWLWAPSAPFTLEDLAESGEARWLEGPLATEIWLNVREDRASVQVIEQGGKAYEVAIVVPGYSRDGLPPLPEPPTPTPADVTPELVPDGTAESAPDAGS